MASPPIPDASEVRRKGRQRLIGAIALVAILVVFVPMVLDSEPRPPRSDKALAIPPKDNAPPLPAPPAPAAKADSSTRAPVNAESPAKAGDGPGPKAEPAKAAILETRQVNPKAPPSATPAPPPAGAAAAASPRLEGFAVQVGAFRDETKLDQARQKLASANIAHYTERLDQQGGLTRLRAGPFPTREAAEGALASLKRSGLDGKVVPLP
jgi:DedD protein